MPYIYTLVFHFSAPSRVEHSRINYTVWQELLQLSYSELIGQCFVPEISQYDGFHFIAFATLGSIMMVISAPDDFADLSMYSPSYARRKEFSYFTFK